MCDYVFKSFQIGNADGNWLTLKLCGINILSMFQKDRPQREQVAYEKYRLFFCLFYIVNGMSSRS